MEPALDRAMFNRLIRCLGIRVRCQDVTSAQKALGKRALLSIKRIRNVIKDGEDFRVLLLDPESGYKQEDDLRKALKNVEFETREEQVEMTYDHLQADEVLRELLPTEIEVPSGFETIGHVAHLNLRPEHEPFKHRIGQVILDKAANVRTVVNKTGIIESKFRTFPMEVLAGEDNTNVDLKVNGLRFKFDFAKVYWNSRLSEEHERLVNNRFKPGDLVIDAFCGVGPFALRAAKISCAVEANDLNPDSVRSLVENAKLNKIPLVESSTTSPVTYAANGKIHAFNMDAREFLQFILKGTLPTTSNTHIVMNLPATAIEFLDALIGSLNDTTTEKLPLVHCYCFSSFASVEDRKKDVLARIKTAMNYHSEDFEAEIREVRDVAPNKYMLCAHFVVPKAVAIAKRGSDGSEAKKPRTE